MDVLRAIRPVEPDDGESLFGLSAEQIRRRISSAAVDAGLGEGFTGHSARVGMAQGLARSGTELPAFMTAGRWQPDFLPKATAVSAGGTLYPQGCLALLPGIQ